MKAILENPSLMRALRRHYGEDPTTEKIVAIGRGEYTSPDVYDDLEWGIRGCLAVLKDARPLTAQDRASLVRWIEEASELLTKMGTTSAKRDDDGHSG